VRQPQTSCQAQTQEGCADDPRRPKRCRYAQPATEAEPEAQPVEMEKSNRLRLLEVTPPTPLAGQGSEARTHTRSTEGFVD
jgi:hypothetical protein